MDFALDDDQITLQGVLRDFLADKSPETAVRAQMDDPAGYDRALWDQMARQLGRPGTAIPEEYGGSGFSFLELGLVLEEMGRALGDVVSRGCAGWCGFGSGRSCWAWLLGVVVVVLPPGRWPAWAWTTCRETTSAPVPPKVVRRSRCLLRSQ